MTMDRPRTLGELQGERISDRVGQGRDEAQSDRQARRRASRFSRTSWAMKRRSFPRSRTRSSPSTTSCFSGLRGQAKTRMLRQLVHLLDDAIPVVAGSEIHDHPFAPVSKHARDLIAVAGDATPIEWIGRDDRYHEKLATPDVTIADLIGEVDMIKHAEGRYLSSELTMHFGLIPAGEPGDLLHQRAARSGTQDPGRACSTCWKSATSRFADIRSGWTWTSAWSSRPTPKTTRTAAGSSRRSRTASAR